MRCAVIVRVRVERVEAPTNEIFAPFDRPSSRPTHIPDATRKASVNEVVCVSFTCILCRFASPAVAEYTVYKPVLMLFGLIDMIHGHLKVCKLLSFIVTHRAKFFF